MLVPTVVICAKVPVVPVFRSILKPFSLLELSVQLSVRLAASTIVSPTETATSKKKQKVKTNLTEILRGEYTVRTSLGHLRSTDQKRYRARQATLLPYPEKPGLR